jgi:electron transfer flavoprotein alpha subunit
MLPVFVYIQHKAGVIDDTAAELVAAARRLDAAQAPTAVVTGWGADLDAACRTLSMVFTGVWRVAGEALAYPNAEVVRQALAEAMPRDSILLIPHNHFGVDLAPGLSIKLNAAFVSDVVGIDGVEGAALRLVRQEFGGQVSTHVRCDASTGAVLTIRPGAFQPSEMSPVAGVIRDVAAWVLARRRYITTVAAEAGDVDITRFKVLVSVGRGIQEADNLGIAEDLAAALGGAVSCSRPVVDAKWMEKSRQVGSSGKTVKPKVYLACGISGSFQHLAGIKGSPFLVAINKNPKAPIFRVADVGIVADILEFLPELTSRIRAERGVSAK